MEYQYGLFAAALMIALVWTIRDTILIPACPELGKKNFAKALALGGAVGVGITLITQFVAQSLLSYLFGGKASVSGLSYPFIRMPWKGKLLSLIVILFLMLVGGGYIIQYITDEVSLRLLGFTGGVALLEELSKAITGIYLYNKYLKEEKNGLFVALAIAGLGFGVGEAFYYFILYANAQLDISFYIIRAIILAPLHGAWTILLALPGQERLLEAIYQRKGASDLLFVAKCCAVPVLLHGFYNTFVSYDNPLSWGIVVASFLLIFKV